MAGPELSKWIVVNLNKQDLTKIGPNCEHLLRLTCSTTFRVPTDTKISAPAPSERNIF